MVETSKLPTKNFLTRLTELKLETGTTGSARVRRIPLFSDLTTGTSVSTTEGNFANIQHVRLEDSVTDIVFYTPVVLPTDFIRGGFPSLHYLYSNDVTSGDVTWVVSIVTIGDEAVASTSVLGDTTSITVGGTADVLTERSVAFNVIVPEPNTILSVFIRRTGGAGNDTSVGIASVWSAWIEYLAHS